MAAVAFDTLRIVKRLKEVGFTDPQAEVVTDVLRETRDADLQELATKADIGLLRSDMKTEFQLLEQRMTIKVGGMMVVVVGAITALLRLL